MVCNALFIIPLWFRLYTNYWSAGNMVCNALFLYIFSLGCILTAGVLGTGLGILYL